MKIKYITGKSLFLSAVIFFLFGSISARAENSDSNFKTAIKIAVVEAKFDKIYKILDRYGIPYTAIAYYDLENSDTLKNYTGVFFPCGIGSHVETNINILSRGTSVQGVFLNEDFLEIDTEKVYSNIKKFIEDGGTAYFSGYSYEYLQGAFNIFKFFDNFPNTGMVGTVNIELADDLNIFCRKNILKGFSDHSGWISVKSISDADILAEGTFRTVIGEKSGPIVARIKRGKGEAIYTSYHGTRESEDFKRYLIFRVVYKKLADRAAMQAEKWCQEINNSIIDSVISPERYRIYPVPLSEGTNSIYFTSENNLFQLDIFDKDYNLLISRDSSERDFVIDLDCHTDDYFIIKVYPSRTSRQGVFSLITACGFKIVPYYKNIIYGLIIIAALFIMYIFKRVLIYRKISGRI